MSPSLLCYKVVAKKLSDQSTQSAEVLPQYLRVRADQLIDKVYDIFSDVGSTSTLARALLCAAEDNGDVAEDDDEREDNGDPSNPLNLIIPAFESPWRAIFYTLLAILQKPPDHCSDLMTLRECVPSSPPTNAAISIARESLRLYPPVRRIRREYQVDVEHIQRNTKYWGNSALRFDASRWLDEQGEILHSPAWLPFADGSMKCPSANRGYSERLILTIVGEMLRQFFPAGIQPRWRLEGKEWDESARRGEVLRSGREQYVGVKLVSD